MAYKLLAIIYGLTGSVAQSVEQRTFNPLVASSNLARPTSYAKGSQQCGPFSFGWNECGHRMDSMEDLLDVSSGDGRRWFETRQLLGFAGPKCRVSRQLLFLYEIKRDWNLSAGLLI